MEIVCIVCPKGCRLSVDERGVRGNLCARGEAYGRKEVENPTRVVTSTVRAEGAACPRLPVKTDRDIPKRMIFDVMRALDDITARAPIRRGDILLADVCGSGVNIVATRDLPAV